MVSPAFAPNTREPRAMAEAAYRCLIEALGKQEASRPELVKTPARAAKAWLELTSGIQVLLWAIAFRELPWPILFGAGENFRTTDEIPAK